MRDWQSYLNFNISKQQSLVCGPETLLLVTVAFNNLETIKTQHALLHKYLSDHFCYIVVDNSSDKFISRKLRSYCSEQNIAYLRPALRLYRSGSKSHGSALNWVYYKFIKNSSARYFAFLDHDLYPVKRTSVLEFLRQQAVYGLLQERAEKWYLWPGFCFFDRQFLAKTELNFSPKAGVVDTGGMNYYSLYKNLSKSSLLFPIHSYRQIADGQLIQETSIEFIGDWLHTFNASAWLPLNNVCERDLALKQLLGDLLK